MANPSLTDRDTQFAVTRYRIMSYEFPLLTDTIFGNDNERLSIDIRKEDNGPFVRSSVSRYRVKGYVNGHFRSVGKFT